MSPRHDGLIRDRDGELVEPPGQGYAPEAPPSTHHCERGFLPRPDGLAPCPVCKPETVKLLRAQRARAQARAAWGTTTTPRSR